MRGVIRLHDATDHGGKVISASASMLIDGLPAALVGDLVSCPLPGHGVTQILPGNSSMVSNSRQIALHGFQAGCGCSLLSSSGGYSE